MFSPDLFKPPHLVPVASKKASHQNRSKGCWRAKNGRFADEDYVRELEWGQRLAALKRRHRRRQFQHGQLFRDDQQGVVKDATDSIHPAKDQQGVRLPRGVHRLDFERGRSRATISFLSSTRGWRSPVAVCLASKLCACRRCVVASSSRPSQ